jgi:hypothetical protein
MPLGLGGDISSSLFLLKGGYEPAGGVHLTEPQERSGDDGGKAESPSLAHY